VTGGVRPSDPSRIEPDRIGPDRIGLDRLSLNQATVRHLTLKEAVTLCVRHDIPAIGLWRDRVAEAGLAEAAAAVRAAGLRVSSLCRGGFFTVADPDGRRAARADNLAAIAEAAELGAGTLVLVSGGLPPGQRDLGPARRMIADAIGSLVPEALRLGVRLGIEALHPMFCADRCVISSLGEAVDLALSFPADAVGVVVDTYHVWWDARLADEIARAGPRIVSYQVCDWVLPLPPDVLLGRGHLGDGCIDFGTVTAAVTAAGYDGDVEVEIFNEEVWDAPPDQTAATVRERFAAVLGGFLRLITGGRTGLGTAEAERYGYQREADQEGDAVRDDEPQVAGGYPVGDPEQEAGQQDREVAQGDLARGPLAEHAADLQDRREAHQHAPGGGGDGEYGGDHGHSFGERRPGLWIVLASDLVRGASTTNSHHRDWRP
jgi:sugar phosphate isomerase/epimerase